MEVPIEDHRFVVAYEEEIGQQRKKTGTPANNTMFDKQLKASASPCVISSSYG